MFFFFVSSFIGTCVLWYLVGKTIVCLILANFNIKEFKEEWKDAGIMEQWLSFIWPFTLIVFCIEWIKEKFDLY